MKNPYSEALFRVIKPLGKTNRERADALGMSPQALSDVISGRYRPTPIGRYLLALAAAEDKSDLEDKALAYFEART